MLFERSLDSSKIFLVIKELALATYFYFQINIRQALTVTVPKEDDQLSTLEQT